MKKLLCAVLLLLATAGATSAFVVTNPVKKAMPDYLYEKVPEEHWTMEASAILFARGVISPRDSRDGISRHELITAFLLALQRINMDKAPIDDLYLLKRLAIEYWNDLPAVDDTVDRKKIYTYLFFAGTKGRKPCNLHHFPSLFKYFSENHWMLDTGTGLPLGGIVGGYP